MPEENYLQSVDDDVAESLAKGMGWNEYQNAPLDQDFVKLGGFGPRVIHSTPEIDPDPLLEDTDPRNIDTKVFLNGIRYVMINDLAPPPAYQIVIPRGAMVYSRQLVQSYLRQWDALRQSILDTLEEIKPPAGVREQPELHKPQQQWVRPFFARRPTEKPKVGRPKRRGKK